MDRNSSCKIQGTQPCQPTAVPPHPMDKRIVNKGYPKEAEDKKGAESHSLGKGPCNQSRSDDCKHALKDHENLMRNRWTVNGMRLHPHPSQANPFKPSNDPEFIRTERHAVAPQEPLEADEAKENKTLHDGPKDILRTHHAAVEQRQSRCHAHDQR